MNIKMNDISTLENMSMCISLEGIQAATQEDTHLQKLKLIIKQNLPQHKEKVEHNMKHYWQSEVNLQ